MMFGFHIYSIKHSDPADADENWQAETHKGVTKRNLYMENS